MRWGFLKRRRKPTGEDRYRLVSVAQFTRKFACDIVTLPDNIVLLGWSDDEARWLCAPEGVARDWAFVTRVPATLAFLRQHVVPILPPGPFWSLLCFSDGWRERIAYSDTYRRVEASGLEGQREWQGAPGEIPVLSRERSWLACYGAHRHDPSALLLPDAHYLARQHFQPLFEEIRAQRIPWQDKRDRAIYCGGNHGECANYFPPMPAGRPHPRQYLHQLATAANLPIDVQLDQAVPLRPQLACKYILDADGYARTWDAWAWKMQSGSVVLSVDSPWQSFFTRAFEPWRHFVPVANDFADLGEKIDWCRQHDDQCRVMAEAAQRRAEEVYRVEQAARVVAEEWQARLAD